MKLKDASQDGIMETATADFIFSLVPRMQPVKFNLWPVHTPGQG